MHGSAALVPIRGVTATSNVKWKKPMRSRRAPAANCIRERAIGGGLNEILVDVPEAYLAGDSRGKDAVRERMLSSTAGGVGTWSNGRVIQVGIQLEYEAVTRPFEQSPWIRNAIKAVAGGFTRLKPRILDRDPSDEEAQEIEIPALDRLLDKPNAIMTQRTLMRAIATMFKLRGDVFLFAQGLDGKPMEIGPDGGWKDVPAQLIPASGRLVEHIRDSRTGMPSAYRYRVDSSDTGGWSQEFPPESVIHIADFDPEDLVRGLGDGDAAMREVDLYHQATRYLDASVRSGGHPGGVVIYAERLQEYEIEARGDLLNDALTGDGAQAFKVLDGAGTKFIPNPVTPKDLEVRGLLEWLRDVMLATMGVPIETITQGDAATFNNKSTAFKQLWQGPNGILTLAAEVQDVFTHCLVRRLTALDRRLKTAHFHLDSSGIDELKEERTEQVVAAANVAALRIGASANAALAAMGVQGSIEGGDVVLPIAEAQPGPPQGGQDEEQPPPAQENAAKPAQEREEVSLPVVAPEPRKLGGDDALRAASLRWLNAYTRAIKARVRAAANAAPTQNAGAGYVRRGLDDVLSPEEMTELEWRELLLDDSEWIERMVEETGAPLVDIYARALTAAQAQVPDGPLLTTSSPRVFRALTAQSIQLSEGVTSRAAQAVRQAILEALAAPGGDPADGLSLRQRVKAVLPELTPKLERVFGTREARAATISQTETGKAEMTGKYAQWAESGVTEIQWFTSQDGEVRVSHKALHGERVPFGMQFSNGLRYPLDPIGTVADVVNCRCDAVPTKRVARPEPTEDQ